MARTATITDEQILEVARKVFLEQTLTGLSKRGIF